MICFDFNHQRKDGSFDVFVFSFFMATFGNCRAVKFVPVHGFSHEEAKTIRARGIVISCWILRFRWVPEYDQFVSESVGLYEFSKNRDVIFVLAFICDQAVCLIFLFMKFPQIAFRCSDFLTSF